MQAAASNAHTSQSSQQLALATFDQLPESAFVRLPVVAALYATTPSTIWRWVKAKRIPAPVKLGPQTTAWRVGELRKALNDSTVAA